MPPPAGQGAHGFVRPRAAPAIVKTPRVGSPPGGRYRGSSRARPRRASQASARGSTLSATQPPLVVDRSDDLCAREPIHVPGTVQAHGVLLAVAAPNDGGPGATAAPDPLTALPVLVASANAAAVLGREPLGLPLAAVLGEAVARELLARHRAGDLLPQTPWEDVLELPPPVAPGTIPGPGHAGAPATFDLSAHRHDGLLLLELEPTLPGDAAAALHAGRSLQRSIARLRQEGRGLEARAELVAQGMRELTGYERVIVYRFDSDWHGQAIAEDKVPDWPQSFAGLHFPASDIPRQARELYRVSSLRWVPDRDREPVPLRAVPGAVSTHAPGAVPWAMSGATPAAVPDAVSEATPPLPGIPGRPAPDGASPDGQAPDAPVRLDLSFARLRSLSPVHLQYHRNMGVDGTMSLSVLRGGALWGLVVCHHRGPHRPSPGVRAAASALTDAFALGLDEAERMDTEAVRRADADRLSRLLAHLAASDDLVMALGSGPVTLDSLFGATGACVVHAGSVVTAGRVPPRADLLALAEWLHDRPEPEMLHTDRLPAEYPAFAPHAAIASGLLALFLSSERDDILVWFRAEEPQEISWGGDPRKQQGHASTLPVLPRQSFERWVEVRHGRARPWSPAELEAAGRLRHAITDVVVRGLKRVGELNEQLRQSQKMEAVGQLTGGLAHDFNNLLTGITGSLELLQTRLGQGRLKDLDRYIAAAQGACRRAAALTHRLLAFSRRQALESRPTDLNRLAAGMEELIRRTMRADIVVELVAAGGLWPTLCDPNQLENALLNLCINARDAMPDGGRLTIETANRWLDQRAARERDMPPGQYVSLSVTDSGTGMPPDVIARAFDPFFTTKPLGQGTGLGLSMIYGFVRQSGGQARIYSEPGQGTTVCLYLPRHLGAVEEAPATEGLLAAPRSERGETVLVVDDEPSVRMLATEVLEELGYQALEAADGPAALRVLQSDRRIDLLVTDLGLPGGLGGRQLAEQGRALRPGLAVLFITGYAENAVTGHGHLEAGTAVLTKPFSVEALAARIREMIATR